MMDKILSDELVDFGGITHLKKYNLNVQNEDGWAGGQRLFVDVKNMQYWFGHSCRRYPI